MVQREWDVGGSNGVLRIRALRGGTITEVSNFLSDVDRAYSSVYLFSRSVAHWKWRRRYWRRLAPFPEEFLWGSLDEGNLWAEVTPDQVPPTYRLELHAVSIHSPGFWEFMGGLNPLQQLREFLKDRHERRKDREYRELAEKDRLRLDNELLQRQILEKETGILRDQIAILREIGLGDGKLQELVWSKIGIPLSRLGEHQDRGLIEGPVEKSEKR